MKCKHIVDVVSDTVLAEETWWLCFNILIWVYLKRSGPAGLPTLSNHLY